MSKPICKKPVSVVIGAAFAGTVGFNTAVAADNPFGLSDLDQGYKIAMSKKPKEGKCGEGKCGGDKIKAETEGKCGGDKAKASTEGKCGEGKCGAGK